MTLVPILPPYQQTAQTYTVAGPYALKASPLTAAERDTSPSSDPSNYARSNSSSSDGVSARSSNRA